MFIRARKRQLKNGRQSISYQLVESVRDGKKVKSKVVCSLGYKSTIQESITEYQRLAGLYQRILEREKQKPRYLIRSQEAHQKDLNLYQNKVDHYSNLISKLSSLL